MGWDDDDEIDIDAKLAAQKKNDIDEEAALINVAKPQAKSAPKVKAAESSGTKTTVTAKEWEVDEVELADPVAEKMRKQRLEMKGDLAAADDLFSGFTKVSSGAYDGGRVREITKVVEKDSFNELQLKTSKDVEAFAAKCGSKLKSSKTKGAAYTFIKDILRAVDAQLEPADCTALIRSLTELEKAKKRAVVDKMQNKKKGMGDIDSMKAGSKVDISAEMGDDFSLE
jgi:hypothetical protein